MPIEPCDGRVVRVLEAGIDARKTTRATPESADKSMQRDSMNATRQCEIELADAKEQLGRAADAGGASSFNVGIGAVVDPRDQVLGDGFVENQPPPGTETEVRYKTTDQWGVVVLFSSSF